MASVTDQTRGAVWYTLCDLEWNVRYYTAMADLYRRRYLWLRFAILAGVFVEAAILYVGTIYAWAFYIGAFGGLALAVLTIWDAVSDYARSAATLRIAAFNCDDLKTDIEELWRDIETYRISDPDAETTLRSITRRWATATQRMQPGTNDRLRRTTAADSNQSIRSRYAL